MSSDYSNSDASLTFSAKNEPKTLAYLSWLRANGAIFDKVDFPAYFDGVCGAKAN